MCWWLMSVISASRGLGRRITLVNIASSKPVCVTQQETVPREKRKAVGVGRSLAPRKCPARSLGETLSPTSSTVERRGNEKRERGRDRWIPC